MEALKDPKGDRKKIGKPPPHKPLASNLLFPQTLEPMTSTFDKQQFKTSSNAEFNTIKQSAHGKEKGTIYFKGQIIIQYRPRPHHQISKS